MQILGVGFSQSDWLKRDADGICFRLSCKWAVKSLTEGRGINFLHDFADNIRFKNKKKSVAMSSAIKKSEQYIYLAGAQFPVGSGVKNKNLSPEDVYDKIYAAEAMMADLWGQIIAAKNEEHVSSLSLRYAKNLIGLEGAVSGLVKEEDFAFVYSFCYGRSEDTIAHSRLDSHSVAFIRIDGEGRYFDPNAGQFFFEASENKGLNQMFSAMDNMIGQMYVGEKSLEYSVLHVFTKL